MHARISRITVDQVSRNVHAARAAPGVSGGLGDRAAAPRRDDFLNSGRVISSIVQNHSSICGSQKFCVRKTNPEIFLCGGRPRFHDPMPLQGQEGPKSHNPHQSRLRFLVYARRREPPPMVDDRPNGHACDGAPAVPPESPAVPADPPAPPGARSSPPETAAGSASHLWAVAARAATTSNSQTASQGDDGQ
jgi:hypothetical protein